VFDILVASGLVAAIVTVVTRPADKAWNVAADRTDSPTVVLLAEPDLPCPWCRAATREDDIRCPSCNQRFG
jgi:hypothetical protein